MANDCETWIRINSNIISFDTLRKTIIEGFEHNGRKWECPFRYGDQTDDIDGANPDPMYINQVYGISRWELDAEYGFACILILGQWIRMLSYSLLKRMRCANG